MPRSCRGAAVDLRDEADRLAAGPELRRRAESHVEERPLAGFCEREGQGRRRGPAGGRHDLEAAGEWPCRVRSERDLQPLLGDVRGPDEQIGRDGHFQNRRRAHGPADLAEGLVAEAVRHLALENDGLTADLQTGEGGERRALEGLAAHGGGRRAPVVKIAAQRLLEEVGNRRRRSGGHGGAGLPLLELVRRRPCGRRRRGASMVHPSADSSVTLSTSTRSAPAFHTDAVTSNASPGAAISRAETASSVTSAAEARAPSASAIFSSRSMAVPPSPSRTWTPGRAKVRQDPRQRRHRGREPRRGNAAPGFGDAGFDVVELLRDALAARRIAHLGRHRAQVRVDSREEVVAAPAGAALHPADRGVVRARLLELAHVLRAVEAAARHRDLVDRLSRERIDAPRLENDGRGVLVLPVARLLQERSGRPRRQPLRGETRKGRGIAGKTVGLARRHAGGLMLAVPVPRGAVENADDDLRAKPPHHAHRVLEEIVLRPLAQRLVERAGEAEIVGAREVLSGAVQTPRRRELLRAHETQADAEVGPDEVLAALAPRQGQVRGLASEAAGHVRQDLAVLVVRMRGDDEESSMRSELRQRPVERFEAAGGRRRKRVARRRRLVCGRRCGDPQRRADSDECTHALRDGECLRRVRATARTPERRRTTS